MFPVFLLHAPIVLFVRCFNVSCVYVFWKFLDSLYKVSCSIFSLNLVIMLIKLCELETHVVAKHYILATRVVLNFGSRDGSDVTRTNRRVPAGE